MQWDKNDEEVVFNDKPRQNLSCIPPSAAAKSLIDLFVVPYFVMPSVSVSVSPTQPVKCDNLKSHLMHSFMVARPVPVPVPAEVPSRSLRVGVPISISINLTKIPDRETKNYVPLMERMFPFMAPYTQNVNYLSVRLAACVEGLLTGGVSSP